MNSKDWLAKRTPDELLQHYMLLRHLPQIDFTGHCYRGLIKQELEKRAVNLAEFMKRLDESDREESKT